MLEPAVTVLQPQSKAELKAAVKPAVKAEPKPELKAELADRPDLLGQMSLLMDGQAGPFISASLAESLDFNYRATPAGTVFTIGCFATGEAAKGPISISMTAITRGEGWRLLGVGVETPSGVLVRVSGEARLED